MRISEDREAERHRLNREYARKVVAEAGPMDPETRAQIVALFRPVARRLREQRAKDQS